MTQPSFPHDDTPPEEIGLPADPLMPLPAGVSEGMGRAAEGPSVVVDLPELTAADFQSAPQRRVVLPILLFLATCASTFWVGATSWMPVGGLGGPTAAAASGIDWGQGLEYMGAVLAILLMHEMGHFFYTLRYKIPASYPLFIPVPINPIGTMGAVIGMDGLKANRKELFDLGLAGPLAGLVVAIPVMWRGIALLDVNSGPDGGLAFHNPLLVQWLMAYLRPELAGSLETVSIYQLNPYFMAGWVGLLITGLNMLPISQLDGGHVLYALFRRRAHKIARAFLVIAIAFIILYIDEAYIWTMMLILVILMGTDHPVTSDDTVSLGRARWLIGVASLSIPVFCFPLWGIKT